MSRLVGIDLGAYSVKVVLANPGFRHATLLEYLERPVPPGPEPHEERAARVVGELVRERNLEHDLPYAAMRGEAVHSRVLDFGFRTLRRADLEKAVGSELEGLLPFDLEDLVFDFEAVPRAPELAVAPPAVAAPGGFGDDDPTNVGAGPGDGRKPRGLVAQPAAGMRVLACAVEKARARTYLALLGRYGAQPRALVAAPAAYARIAERLGHSEGGAPAAGPIAIIDLGHAATQLCVVHDHKVAFVRTIDRGGRDVTESIARAWSMSYEESERAKHADGFVGSAGEPPPSDAWRRIHDVVVTELLPLARELRHSLRVCRAETGVLPASIVLVGGGSRLRGVVSFMAEQLGIPVGLLGPVEADKILGAKLVERGVPADLACLAAATAFEGGTGRPAFNLRQGELAFRADLSFLRAKGMQLAAAALIVVACAAGNAYAALYKLRQAEKTLDDRLATESQELFGQPLEAAEVLTRATPQKKDESPLPKMTAYDLLLDISARLPERKAITLDVSDLDIKQGKITLKATAATAEEIQLIENKLKEQKCFEEVSATSITAGANGVMNFSLTIKSACI